MIDSTGEVISMMNFRAFTGSVKISQDLLFIPFTILSNSPSETLRKNSEFSTEVELRLFSITLSKEFEISSSIFEN